MGTVLGWGGMVAVGREVKKRMEVRWEGECGEISGAADGRNLWGKFWAGRVAAEREKKTDGAMWGGGCEGVNWATGGGVYGGEF